MNVERNFAFVAAAAVALFLCCAAPQNVASASAQGVVKIVGIGAATCSEFLTHVEAQPGEERTYFAWAQGYMNGLLVRAPAGKDEGLDLAPPSFSLERQAAFLRTFCSENTGADFTDGVNMLYRTLRAPPG